MFNNDLDDAINNLIVLQEQYPVVAPQLKKILQLVRNGQYNANHYILQLQDEITANTSDIDIRNALDALDDFYGV